MSAVPIAPIAPIASIAPRVSGWQQAAWLALYDLKSLWRERGPLWLLLVAVVLALLALAQGASFHSRVQVATQAAQAQELAARGSAAALAQTYFANPADPQFTELKWWRSPVDIRGYAFREHLSFAVQPALPGAALAVGQADVLPAYVRVRAESMEGAASAYEIEHPARLAVGRFDLMFFVIYLWPLALLALGSSVLTQEREARRLPGLHLQGVASWRLLLAQVLTRTLGATAVLLLTVVAAALIAGIVPATGEGAGAGARALATWSGIVVLYTLFWAGVVAVVCSLCAQRVTAAFAGFGAWVLLTVLAPALLTAGVSLAAPVPSRELYIDALRDAGDRVSSNRVQMLERFYDQHPQWRPVKTALDKLPGAVTRLARAQEQERLLANVSGRFEAARTQRDTLFARWSWLSPVTLASVALARTAGTDAQRHRVFMAEAQAHHQRLRDFFQAGIQQAALRDEQAPCPVTCRGGYGFEDFDAVPTFSASPALLQATPFGAGAIAIAAWALALLALAVWRVAAPRAPAVSHPYQPSTP